MDRGISEVPPKAVTLYSRLRVLKSGAEDIANKTTQLRHNYFNENESGDRKGLDTPDSVDSLLADSVDSLLAELERLHIIAQKDLGKLTEAIGNPGTPDSRLGRRSA